ncbi:MarR family winged helix-turn-helix transcriptional regulator [Sphaerisporangium dianthi]|uniref:MarR family winged helix-turn-helix transcriptional regulator n=1 Tax=Sphaerisporangium dianthi TaxID=1436120 RepID=A0ABV9CNJ2_9ACTN
MTPGTQGAAGSPAQGPAAGALSELLCFHLYTASRSLTAVYRPLLEPLGLTYPQYLVMLVLWRHDGSTVRDVVDQLQLDYNTVSPLLKRLEARGLLSRRRRADDERTVELVLTGEGRALRARARHIPGAIGEAVGIDGSAVGALQRTLREVTASASAYAADKA